MTDEEKEDKNEEKEDKNEAIMGCFGLVVLSILLILIVWFFIDDDDPDSTSSEDANIVEESQSAPVFTKKTQEQFIQLYNDVKITVEGCDSSATTTNDALASLRGNLPMLYEVYALADRTHTICEKAWLKLQSFESPPGIEGEAKETLDHGLSLCSTAYYLKTESLKTIKEVLDGDYRPSKAQEYVETTKEAKGLALSCLLQINSAAITIGLKPGDLEPGNSADE